MSMKILVALTSHDQLSAARLRKRLSENTDAGQALETLAERSSKSYRIFLPRAAIQSGIDALDLRIWFLPVTGSGNGCG